MNPTLDLLSEFDEKFGLESHSDICIQFMLQSCELIKYRLSASAKAALVVAQRYWTGLATEAELDAARVACWQELDAKSWSTNTDEPDACATRAVICLLYPKWSEGDVFEHVAWFIQMANKAEDHWMDQRNILQGLIASLRLDQSK